jgi:hypothetical protein
MAREYLFTLPYTAGRLATRIGLNRLKRDGLFTCLPLEMQQRMQFAVDEWQGVTITKKDCDAIDDETWTKIAAKLGLRWRTAAAP